jgi:carboxylesterase type B
MFYIYGGGFIEGNSLDHIYALNFYWIEMW